MDCSPPGSSVRGTLQEKNTEMGCHFLYSGSSWPRTQSQASYIGRGFFTAEPLEAIDLIGYERSVCYFLPGTLVMSTAITRHLHKLPSSSPFWTEPSCYISIFSSYEIASRRVKKNLNPYWISLKIYLLIFLFYFMVEDISHSSLTKGFPGK